MSGVFFVFSLAVLNALPLTSQVSKGSFLLVEKPSLVPPYANYGNVRLQISGLQTFSHHLRAVTS